MLATSLVHFARISLHFCTAYLPPVQPCSLDETHIIFQCSTCFSDPPHYSISFRVFTLRQFSSVVLYLHYCNIHPTLFVSRGELEPLQSDSHFMNTPYACKLKHKLSHLMSLHMSMSSCGSTGSTRLEWRERIDPNRLDREMLFC